MTSWFGWGSNDSAPSAPPAPLGTTLLNTQPRLPGTGQQPVGTGPGGTGPFQVGEVVEYFSASASKWIPAKVLVANPNGTFNLDCKPDVTPDKLRRPPAANTINTQPLGTGAMQSSAQDEFRPGDIVEYFGATQQTWIPAKVLSTNPNGTFNLDCKPDVPRDRIRKPVVQPLGSSAVGGGYRVGDNVEYYGATAGKWIPAKVVVANSNGTFDLDCKPGVTADKIRWPQPSGSTYKEGDRVQYLASSGQWIDAKVLGANDNGTYNLDCKPDVPPFKIRFPTSDALGSTLQVPTANALGSGPMGTGPLGSGAVATYRAGDTVEYFGATAGKWIPAKVLKVNPNGTYDLDCKPDVPPEKIRWPQSAQPLGSGAVGNSAYNIGDVVDYYSTSQAAWIPAKIIAVNGARGTYDLDCKPDVSTDKIRPPSAPGRATVVMYQVGETVEYFGATQNRWIPAKVVAANGDGTYHLDCKQSVTPDKIRRPMGAPGTVPSTNSRSTMYPATQSLGSTAQVGTLDHPVQLLRVQRAGGRWRYEVCPEGARVLEQYGGRRLAVASICGLHRTGKSFLLNLLTERSQRGMPPFQVGGTEGIWLWGDSTNVNDAQAPLIALLDSEGFGNTGNDLARDAQLMTLCALLSSVLLLNTKGALNDSLFNSLVQTCKFAEHVEERGNECSRPSLIWVLRDFMLDLRDAGGQSTTPDDYLEKALHANSSGQESQAAREVRQNLLQFFSHRNCVTLVPPVNEEAQLRRLDALPYNSLRQDFRMGIEGLRTQVMTQCHNNPKSVGGQPVSCLSFIALLRQLAAALNENKLLSVRGAWETVQHTTCGELTDRLRGVALESLHALAGGRQLASGAQLPMTDEALRAELRSLRHTLKAQWDKQAVGDELVREEYWQELKESLAREETLVRQQNTRLADQQLKDALTPWQEWLDNEDGTPGDVENVCRQLGQLMERMPAAPLSRAGRVAVEAAAHRVAAARSAVARTLAQEGEIHRQAMEWGEQAAQQEGTARTQLQEKKTQLQQAKEQLEERKKSHADLQRDVESQDRELQEAKAKLQALLAEVEASRAEEHDHKAKLRLQADNESRVQTELEQLRAASAKANAERLASERCARTAADTAAAEQRRLEVEIGQARAEAEKLSRQLQAEKDNILDVSAKTKQEHAQRVDDIRKQLEEERRTLMGEKEKTRSEHSRMHDDIRAQLDEERNQHKQAISVERDKQLERERRAGILEGQVQALTSETTALRKRLQELEEKKREVETRPARHMEENARKQKELEKARANIQQVKQDAEAKLAAQQAEHTRRIAEEEEKLAQSKKKKGGLFSRKSKDPKTPPAKAA